MDEHHVVVVGGGFAGLEAVRSLAGAPVRITIIDQRNHHLFQPLLYQVATAMLATSEIAWPIRHLFRDRPEVDTVLATVEGVDAAKREVILNDGSHVPYDTLVLATGATHAYFGHDEWEKSAPGLKNLEDATTIRRRMLMAFERAERATDPARRQAFLTFVIIGGGPTGVELAGAIAELAHVTLVKEFRHIDPHLTRVVLIEAGPRILSAFTEDLSAYAQKALEKLGVEVRTGAPVTQCAVGHVVFGNEKLATATILWAAGVKASPAALWLGAKADRAGRVIVEPDLTLPGHPEIFVIGDTASVIRPDGSPVPGIAPAAKQQGGYAARIIKARLAGASDPGPFHYKHSGNLATIGKRAAVIDFGWIKLRGQFAWWIWGIAHVFFLIGTRNRIAVALSWLWIYLSGHRSARLITQGQAREKIVSLAPASAKKRKGE